MTDRIGLSFHIRSDSNTGEEYALIESNTGVKRSAIDPNFIRALSEGKILDSEQCYVKALENGFNAANLGVSRFAKSALDVIQLCGDMSGIDRHEIAFQSMGVFNRLEAVSNAIKKALDGIPTLTYDEKKGILSDLQKNGTLAIQDGLEPIYYDNLIRALITESDLEGEQGRPVNQWHLFTYAIQLAAVNDLLDQYRGEIIKRFDGILDRAIDTSKRLKQNGLVNAGKELLDNATVWFSWANSQGMMSFIVPTEPEKQMAANQPHY